MLENKNRLNINVLLVDDERRFLTTTARLLEKKGLLVTIADNGYEAIDAVKNNYFDVIILDENMPGLSGIETLHGGKL